MGKPYILTEAVDDNNLSWDEQVALFERHGLDLHQTQADNRQ
jgi:hypothetical protein